MSKYKCSKCGMSVIVTNDKKIIKPCKCDAAITADIFATTKGFGKTK